MSDRLGATQEITDFPEPTVPSFPDDPAESAPKETALNTESTGPAEPAFSPEQPKAELASEQGGNGQRPGNKSRNFSSEPSATERHMLALLQSAMTSAELLDKHFEPMSWLAQDLIPAEGLTVLGSKMGNGKSYFLLQLAAALSTGTPFLGRQTKRQGVLLIALEDSERRIHARLEQLKIIGTDKLIIFTRWAKGKHALEDLRIILRCHPEVRTVIIDPIVKFIDLLDFDFNEYGGAYDRLTPIKDILDGLHVAGIFSHHCKKSVSELDAFDDLLGSTGWGAACDTRLVLRRERGSDEGTLVAGGRDVLHSESALLFDGDRGWQYQGTVADVRISGERKQILELLDEAGPLSVTEVSKRLEKNYSTIRTLVQKLMKSGNLIHEGKKVTLATRKSVVNVVPVVEEEEGKTTETTESIETTETTEMIEKREEDDSLSSRARARTDILEGIKRKLNRYQATEVLERARWTLEQFEGTEGET